MSPSTNFHLAEEIFQEARIADELCPSSIRKYGSSVKAFLAAIGSKRFENLSKADFDAFIIRMKERDASNSRISDIIAAMP